MHHLSVKLAGGSEQCQLLVLQVDLKVLLHLNLWFVKKIRVSDYPLGFGYSRVLVLGMDFHPNQSSGQVWVSFFVPNTARTRTEPDPLPSLSILSINKLKAPFGHL